jgi:hypothetical protein
VINWVPLALEPKTYTWVCGRDDGTLLLAVPEQVEIKRQRNAKKSAKELLRVTEVGPGVESIQSTYLGSLLLEIMLIKNYAIKAAYSDKLRTWFVAQGSVQHYKDIRPMEQVALEINEHLRRLNDLGGSIDG